MYLCKNTAPHIKIQPFPGGLQSITKEQYTTPIFTTNSLLAQNTVDEDDSSMNEAVAPHSTDHAQPLHRLVHIVHLVRKGL